jgi:hypothetical protein
MEGQMKRNKECPNCHVDWWNKGSHYRGGEWSYVWECPNCSHEEPRRENKVGEGISPSQKAAVEAVRARMLRPYYEGDVKEVKSEEVKLESYGAVVMVIEVGKPGDESNMLSVFGRGRLQVFIGRGGGLMSYAKGLKKVYGNKVFLECVER